MSSPDEIARLAAEAQTGAREAAARVILHAEAWSSAAAAVRAVRTLELAVHAEVLGHIRRAREAGESWAALARCLASARSPLRDPGRSPSSRLTIPPGCRPSTLSPHRRCSGGTASAAAAGSPTTAPSRGQLWIRTATAAAACAWRPDVAE